MVEKEKTEDSKINGSRIKGIIAISLLAFALSLLIGTFVYKFTSGYFEKMEMVRKASGNTRNVEVVLPDGSKVWLNTNSEIRYPKEFGPNIREVFFEGEAFFAVVKNEEKPFILHSVNSRIEIVGTTFDLKAYPEGKDLTLSVVSGEVILFDGESDENAVQLKDGEQGLMNYSTKRIDKIKNTNINYLSWQTGKFFFKNAPLSEVIAELNTYYDKKIVIEQKALGDCKISLDINRKHLEEVLGEIQKQANIKYEVLKGRIIIQGGSCL